MLCWMVVGQLLNVVLASNWMVVERLLDSGWTVVGWMLDDCWTVGGHGVGQLLDGCSCWLLDVVLDVTG